MSERLLPEGHRVSDTILVERFLGEGAFAEVYRVQHAFLGRQALKVMKSAGTTVREIHELLREASLLSRIGHPNIVRVFDANVLSVNGSSHGYFTMEYVAGGTLDRHWRAYGNRFIPVSDAVEITRQVCSGLAVAHAEKPPIVHRDIKPQNILVGYDATGLRARVSDFGVAKSVNPMTQYASAGGTPLFKGPEAMRDNRDSPAGDVWGVGTTLYMMLTDLLPFPTQGDRSPLDLRRFEQPLRPASDLNAEVDIGLDAIVARCLALKPSERYADATALLADLLRWAPGTGAPRKPAADDEGMTTKDALGLRPPADRAAADGLVREALRLSKQPGKLPAAADLMEEAISKNPELRERYEAMLRLWRKGLCM